MNFARKFPCPACGYLVFKEPPGSEERCPICGWIDDLAGLQFPGFAGGPNRVSLLEAQRNFVQIGARDAQQLPNVRFATAADRRDPDWRALDEDRDEIASLPNDFDGLAPPQDLQALYYWRPA